MSSSTPQNCAGTETIADGGHNLSFPDATCPGSNGDPRLGPLQGNGGFTQTMALGMGSAALDMIPATGANCPATDQRGVPRPQPAGRLCDIGAYEFVYPPVCQPTIASTSSGQAVTVQLICLDGAADPLTYAVDANPAHGSLTSFNSATGSVTFTPTAGYSGADSLTYHASSVNGTSATQTVSITVGPAPMMPGGGARAVPSITALRVAPNALRAAGTGGSIASASGAGKQKKAKTGATISYADSQAASTTFTVLESESGILSSRGCVKPPRRRPRHAKRCRRLVALGGFRRQDRAGANSFHFTGRVASHKLARGKYTLRAVPLLGARKGATATATFSIIG